SLVLILTTIVAGLTVRMAPLGLPQPVTKYGGSMLWALTIYWLVTMLLPSMRIRLAAVMAGAAATAVELFKLCRSPAIDAFRATLPGTLLLGRHFSVKDIVAYWLAIVLGALIDYGARRTVV